MLCYYNDSFVLYRDIEIVHIGNCKRFFLSLNNGHFTGSVCEKIEFA